MPTPPKKPFNWGRFSKTLSFWIIVILIPVMFVQFSNGGREQAPTIDYTRYSSEELAAFVTTIRDVAVRER